MENERRKAPDDLLLLRGMIALPPLQLMYHDHLIKPFFLEVPCLASNSLPLGNITDRSSKQCPKSANCQFSDRADLKMCKKCKCAFYCDQKCQKSDWRRHKQFCHENENSATYIEVARSRAGMGEAYFELPEHQGLD